MSKQQRHERDADYWKREVDIVIDLFEKQPNWPGGTVLQFNCTKAELPFAFEIAGKLHYRGRILDPVSKPKQRKPRDIQMDIEGK